MATVHPSIRVPLDERIRTSSRRAARWRWAILAALLVGLLHLVPPQTLVSLDSDSVGLSGPQGVSPPPVVQTDETFPGSAYFFAQDAFAPWAAPAPTNGEAGDPAVTTIEPGAGSTHILQIEAGPAALAMPMRAASFLDQARALQCMTNALYYEAANEPDEGQRAVAQVILNRVASSRWPDSICGTIYQGGERSDRKCQFTFSCDGSMARLPASAAWARARANAKRALSGEVFPPAGLATFYHTLAVHPGWADTVRPVAVIGAHIFYRLPGAAGAPASYGVRYSGRETAQPGPYAFVKPPTPFILPPGPGAAPPWATGEASLPVAAVVNAGAPTPALPTIYLGLSSAPPVNPVRSDAGLPQSTIRPEYRNTGRPLR